MSARLLLPAAAFALRPNLAFTLWLLWRGPAPRSPARVRPAVRAFGSRRFLRRPVAARSCPAARAPRVPGPGPGAPLASGPRPARSLAVPSRRPRLRARRCLRRPVAARLAPPPARLASALLLLTLGVFLSRVPTLTILAQALLFFFLPPSLLLAPTRPEAWASASRRVTQFFLVQFLAVRSRPWHRPLRLVSSNASAANQPLRVQTFSTRQRRNAA